MLKEIKILSDHGKQYVPDLRTQSVSARFRGRPVISAAITPSQGARAAALCPSGAIDGTSGAIDLGRCTFCKECALAIPEVYVFTNDYRIAVTKREDLVIRPGQTGPLRIDEAAVRNEVRRLFRRSLKLRQVSAGGDNSCEMELGAAGNVNFDMGRYGIEFVASPRHADGIVITGPVSENMARALGITYEAIPSPKVIILSGTDAISGGLFAGSPAINRDFIDNHHVDLYVPGNPAHPLTFINGLLDLLGKKQ
ncbi:MAG: NADH:ubiquinone oxidoreductase [Bacteroidales bacterium]|jgi:Ni,Fe-hydrogenase III small subunit/ferredoxin|nr:NADH:ubiquinone oxidoreductase [Bacteroidales bacterium]